MRLAKRILLASPDQKPSTPRLRPQIRLKLLRSAGDPAKQSEHLAKAHMCSRKPFLPLWTRRGCSANVSTRKAHLHPSQARQVRCWAFGAAAIGSVKRGSC